MSQFDDKALSSVSPRLYGELRRPEPRVNITIRTAIADDFSFIDQLQKMYNKMVGFMPRRQLETYIARDEVLIAEDELARPLGYLIGRDRYLKREDLGVI